MTRSTSLLALCAALICGTPGLAQSNGYNPGQDTVVITRAPDGSGATISVRDRLGPTDAAILFGIDMPPSSDAFLIVEAGRAPRWSTDTLSDIDRELGGDGQVEIDIFPDDGPGHRPDAAPATPRASDSGASGLFSGGAIQPRNGTWQGTPSAPQVLGCPSMIASNMGSFLSAGQSAVAPRSFTFDRPFNPAALPGLSDQLNFDWLQSDANTWVGSADLPGAQGMTPHMRLTVRVASPERIETVGVVFLNFPEQLVRTLGGGGDCRTLAESALVRVGD